MIIFIIKNSRSGTVVQINENELQLKYINPYFLDCYKVPLEKMNLDSSGDYYYENKIIKAFDGDNSTYWLSKDILNQKQSIYINVIFTETIIINSILYLAPFKFNEVYGYPNELKIYIKLKNSEGILSENDNDYLLIENFISETTGNYVLFKFDEEIMCDQIKLEWNDIQSVSANSRAAASEIYFLYPENKYINEILDAFENDDYAQLFIKSKYKDLNIIENLYEKAKESCYIIPESFKELINRIRMIIEGKIKYEEKREFSTNKNSKYKINQYGDINKYTTKILRMAYGSTNNQCTGIYGLPNQKITIYVDAKDNDPLPYIKFNQFLTNQFNNLKLKKGKNVFIFDNFETNNLEIKTNPGGPIYIINTFTSEEQSENVKIYIEGGIFYPIFRLNDNENEFKKFLNDYILLYKENINTYLNITEFYSNKILITVSATDANEIYNIKEKSPQKNLLTWEDILKKFYIFSGIQFEKNQPYYDIKNEYINIHIRHSQPKEGAQAYANEYNVAIYYYTNLYEVMVSYEGIGNTLPHEIGHMIDEVSMKYEERTNNVLREFTREVIYNYTDSLQYNFDLVTDKLSPDNIHPLLRGCIENNITKCIGFFNLYGNYKQSYLLWWNIESLYHGYWGKLNNLYRYNSSIIVGMSKTESMVLMSSLVLGFDTGYYFERFGFGMKFEQLFNNTNPSEIYKNKLNEFISQGLIKTSIEKKFWYIDAKEYNYISNHKENYYSSSEYFNIYQIEQNKYGYNITFPTIFFGAHLGVELLENDKVIAFVHGNGKFFIDKTLYPTGYKPKYKMIAYDRFLHCSGLPSNYFPHNNIIKKNLR